MKEFTAEKILLLLQIKKIRALNINAFKQRSKDAYLIINCAEDIFVYTLMMKCILHDDNKKIIQQVIRIQLQWRLLYLFWGQ